MEEKGNSSQQSSPALVPSGVLLEAEVFWFTPYVGVTVSQGSSSVSRSTRCQWLSRTYSRV